MKIILAGSSGFIGSEVLARCLEHPAITSIIALSRRELPPAASDNAKAKVVILDDFLSYPENVLKDIRGADACIWYSNFPLNSITPVSSIPPFPRSPHTLI